jgi:acyl transferase domain-containing protein/acyl carrier protein
MNHPDDVQPPQGIAIVGMAGRFPGARTLRQFWENLRDGVESISFFSDEELLASGVDPELLRDESYVKAKAILDDVEGFDAAFFGFTPREAELLDPQHRVLLECAWEALEDAGYDPRRSGGRTAVYVGSGTSAYLLSNLLPSSERMEKTGVFQALLSNDRDFLATRLSYKLDLRGPSVLVQTACSTSLTAVHLACQSLLSGEADMALAGGVSIGVPVKDGYLYQEGSIASPDGLCRAFDARAGGSVAGDGAGIVVLKRLADALADGDRIHAVIRGSAANNDGSGKVGYTAPSIEGQAEVITEALLMAGVEPDSIGYVEAHGSGTALGDPVEVTALTQAFRGAGSVRTGFCALGSVKTNVGHCNTAAGVAGLIKAVLTLEHGEIPPSLHYEQPNPQIDFAGSPFFVNAGLRPWPKGDAPRRAGVSSFGMGGTNVHMVLEEAPPREPAEPSRRPAHLIPVSARTPAALEAATANLADLLRREPEVSLADVAFTLQVGRRGFDHRRFVVARDPADAAAALADPRRAIPGAREGTAARPVVFLFPGLGDQYVDMARELYDAEPAFREQIDRCAEILAPRLGFDVRRAIFSDSPAAPRPEGQGLDLRALLRRDAPPEDPAAARLARTDVAQPACFAVEYALARLLLAWGIAPEAMIGYSIGEYVAACLAGVLSLEDALSLVARRAQLIQELPAGSMLAVPLPEAEVRPLLGEALSVSATNGPHLTVVGGPAEAVEALARRLEERGASTLRLQTTHAFHSAMTEPAVAPFAAIARQVRMSPPRIPYLSNVTGTWITAADLEDPAYWVRHMRQTVRFAEGLTELLADPSRLFLEVGPGATLGALARQHPDAPAGLVAASTLRRASEARSDVEHLLEAVGRLWSAGAEVDWNALWAGERRQRVELPTYPFERQRCWIDPPRGGRPAVQRREEPATRADLADWFYAPVWKQSPLARTSRSVAGTSWLLFLDETGFGERLAERLRRDGAAVTTVAVGESLPEVAGFDRIVHLRALTRDEPAFAAALESGLASLVLLQQALSQGAGDGPVRIAVVGNHLQEILEGDPVVPAKAVVLGAVKILHQESPRLACGAVDVVLPEPGSPAEERLIAQVLDEIEAGLPPVVALRGRQRWIRSFERIRMEATDPAASPLHPGGSYLITDGAHGVGPSLAEHLAGAVGARVAVVLPPGTPAGPQPWEGLEGVQVLHADLAAPGGARSVLDRCGERLGRLDGVFVTGGSYTGGLLQLKTAEGLAAALGPLARGTEALLDALGGLAEPPAFVALCASTLTFSGGLGQLDIAVTGAWLDALALRCSASGGPPVLALHWDPHQWGDWLAGGVGAGVVPGLAAEQLQKELEALRIPPAESGEALRRLLASGLSRAIVSAGDFESLLAETDAFTIDVFLAEMEKARHSAQPHRRTGLSTPYVEPRDKTEEKLAALWADLFGIDRIGVEDNFLELGGHSLLAIQLMTQIRNAFEVDLPVTALFEAPTIAGLAQAIATEQRGGEEDPAELEKLLALVEGLSPEEALAKMAELGLAVPEEAAP